MSKIIIVLTSHTQLGNTGRKTGFYYEELAAPYWTFIDAGHSVDIASVAGGPASYDPASLEADESKRPESVRRFMKDASAMDKLSKTHSVDNVEADNYDCIFLSGGHGAMWDFPASTHLAELLEDMYDKGDIVGAVCHGPAGLLNAKRADGKPLVSGLKVNSFTNAEEDQAGLTGEMPFLLETKIKEAGGVFESSANFTAKAVRDGQLVTGQNPMSSKPVADLIVKALAESKAKAA